MIPWLRRAFEALRISRPSATAEAAPYRAMPLAAHLRPRTSWRPVIERSLALFNAAALACLVLWWVTYQGSPYYDYKADQARILTGVAGGGSLGFLGWFWYGFRLRLILVSGVFWAFIGALTLAYGLTPYPYMLRILGQQYPATVGGAVCIAVGAASVATFLRRDRSRYSAGGRAGARGLG